MHSDKKTSNLKIEKKFLKIAVILIILFFSYFSQLNAQDAQSYYQDGYQFFSQGDYNKAEENYKKAIELNPNFENAHYWLGKTFRQTGQYDRAVTQWINVLRINPRNSYAFQYLNDSFRNTSKVTSDRSGDFLLAGLNLIEIQKDIFLDEKSVDNYSLLSAIPYLKKAADLNSNNIAAYYWLAEVYEALSKKVSWQYTSLAISSFEKVIATEEKNNPSAFQRPSEYWYSYQELIRIFQSLGLNERKDDLIEQLREVKAAPFEQVLNNAGYTNLGYPDTIEIIKEDSKELIELWKYEKEQKTLRIVNKEVVGEELFE